MSMTALLGQPPAPPLLCLCSLGFCGICPGPEVHSLAWREQRLMGLLADDRFVVGQQIDQFALQMELFATGNAGSRGSNLRSVVFEFCFQVFGTETRKLPGQEIAGQLLDFAIVCCSSRTE